MNVIVRFAVSLVVGLLAFAAFAVGVTAWFEQWIEFSLMIGIPVGLSAGVVATFAAFTGLWYRDQAREGPVSRTADGVQMAAFAAVADFLGVTGLGVVVFFLFDGSLGIGLLVLGLPVTMVVAAAAGFLAVTRGRRGEGGVRRTSG